MKDPRAAIRAKAMALGFDAIGFARAELGADTGLRLRKFLSNGYHGEMSWLAERTYERSEPKNLWSEARSVISLGLTYCPDQNPLTNSESRSIGNISVYARNRDYHQYFKGLLKHLAQCVVSEIGCDVKVFVDTAPVMEKPLAEKSGLGWIGKHTNLVSRRHGSWLFLGEIYVNVRIEEELPHPNLCGTCSRCLDICPTHAFPAAYQLDATRCISYLTIEHRGSIPINMRENIGNRIYGCDDCLAACPWNRFARDLTPHPQLQARSDLKAPNLGFLASLGEGGFRQFFSGSPIKRIGWTRFLRNVLIAIGNSQDVNLVNCITPYLNHDDAVIAETSAWAEKRLAS